MALHNFTALKGFSCCDHCRMDSVMPEVLLTFTFYVILFVVSMTTDGFKIIRFLWLYMTPIRFECGYEGMDRCLSRILWWSSGRHNAPWIATEMCCSKRAKLPKCLMFLKYYSSSWLYDKFKTSCVPWTRCLVTYDVRWMLGRDEYFLVLMAVACDAAAVAPDSSDIALLCDSKNIQDYWIFPLLQRINDIISRFYNCLFYT